MRHDECYCISWIMRGIFHDFQRLGPFKPTHPDNCQFAKLPPGRDDGLPDEKNVEEIQKPPAVGAGGG